MFCKCRPITFGEIHEMNPSATNVPKDTYVLTDIDDKDLIIASDMIENIAKMQLFICFGKGYGGTHIYGYSLKQNLNDKSIAILRYDGSDGRCYYVKISDVDIWCNAE